jgi:RimJ/RimL family protein N-acetyltransferase
MTVAWPREQPTLTDGVLVLRPWAAEDVDAVFRACQDPAIQRYTAVPTPYLREHAESFVLIGSRETWESQTGAGFAVTSAESGELLAACGLVRSDVAKAVTAAGYWVAPWARRQGVARGSLSLVTTWALDDLEFDRVEVEIEAANVGSLAVAVSLGFMVADDSPRVASLKGVDREFTILHRSKNQS